MKRAAPIPHTPAAEVLASLLQLESPERARVLAEAADLMHRDPKKHTRACANYMTAAQQLKDLADEVLAALGPREPAEVPAC